MLDGVDLFDDVITEQQRFRPKVGAKLGKRPKSSKVGNVKPIPCDVAPSKQCETSDAAAGTTVIADKTTTEAKEKMILAELPIDTGALENHFEIDVLHGITEGSLGNALYDACKIKINGDVDNEKSVEPDEVNTHALANSKEKIQNNSRGKKVSFVNRDACTPQESNIAERISGDFNNDPELLFDGSDVQSASLTEGEWHLNESTQKSATPANWAFDEFDKGPTYSVEVNDDGKDSNMMDNNKVSKSSNRAKDNNALSSKRRRTSKKSPSQKEDEFDKGPTYSVEVNDDGQDANMMDNNKVSKRSNRAKDNNALSSKRRRTSEKSPSQKEAPKKLPHRVRQKRRQVVKHLFDKPEEEIDRNRIPIKNLLLYAEAKERMWSKDPSARASTGASSSRRRKNKSSDDVFGYDDEQRNDDDADLKSSAKLNNHSYMNIRYSTRWTQPETDLFYQAIRLFRTDFTTIQREFPSRTLKEVKQKFKNEEKKFPYKVQEALVHAPKDFSHYKKVLELLRIENSKKSTEDSCAADGETGTVAEFDSAGNDDYGIENENAGMPDKDELESYDGVDDHKEDSTVAPDFDSFFD